MRILLLFGSAAMAALAAGPSFEKDVQPILKAIWCGTPSANSLLLDKIVTGQMPPGGVKLEHSRALAGEVNPSAERK